MILAAGTVRIASCSITTIIVGNVTASPHGNECRAVPNVGMMLKATVMAMVMTNKKIYDYYIYERNDGFGKEAIEVLAKINKTTEDGIKAILREQGVTFKEDEPMMTKELKAQIIKDYNEGMTIKDIAERYQLNAHTLSNNMKNWHDKGLVTLRLPEKPKHIPAVKEKPKHEPTPKTEQVKEEPDKAVSDNSKRIEVGSAIDRLKLLQGMMEVILQENGVDYEITGIYALNSTGCCEIKININSEPYILQMKRAEE